MYTLVRMIKISRMYAQGVEYTLTICPTDEQQHWKSPSRLYDCITTAITKLTKLNYCKYVLYPEISNKGRVHYHGKITIIDVVPFLLYTIKQLEAFGLYEIDTIKDPSDWDLYCLKDTAVMKPALLQLDLPYRLSPKSVGRLLGYITMPSKTVLAKLLSKSEAEPKSILPK